MRMRSEKAKPTSDPVPTDDLVNFLMKSQHLFPKFKESDIESAVRAFTNGRDTMTIDEFIMFASG